MYGRIETVNYAHGFGFIRTKDGREIFFHRSSLLQLDFRNLKKGQEVEFEERGAGNDTRAVVVRPSRA
jgi:cold shock CspA family protein